jgi:hypothetical protein
MRMLLWLLMVQAQYVYLCDSRECTHRVSIRWYSTVARQTNSTPEIVTPRLKHQFLDHSRQPTPEWPYTFECGIGQPKWALGQCDKHQVLTVK